MVYKLIRSSNDYYHSRHQNLDMGFDFFFPVVIWFANAISNTHRDSRFRLGENDRLGFSEVQVFISLLEIRKICKEGRIGYVRKARRLRKRPRKCEAFIIQRSCRLLPRNSSRVLKITSPRLSIPESEAAGGLQSSF